MAKTIYPYVEDDILLEEVSKVFHVMENELLEIDEGLYDNVIDPFSAFFDSAYQNISHDDWIKQEKSRQLQKTLQNTIGYFHQHILGAVSGWSDPGAGAGYDSENKRRKIFAEIKNKYNTFNDNSAKKTYENMVTLIEGSKKGYRGYVVLIIPKKTERFIKPFVQTGNPARKDLMCVDGATYYEIVTGDKNGLRKLFEALPVAIAKIKGSSKEKLKTESDMFLGLFARAYGEK